MTFNHRSVTQNANNFVIKKEESLVHWKSYISTFVIVCALAVTGFAQVDQGRVAGTIKDQTGAVIPGVTITVKNDRTGEERSVVSGEKGDYLVVALKPSTYTVSAMLLSFAKAEVSGLQLIVGQTLNLDLVLKPAGVTQELTVSADAAEVRVETSSASLGANVRHPGSGRASDQRPPAFAIVFTGARGAEHRQRPIRRHSF